MGACNFDTVGYGKTAQEAFSGAVAEAEYEHGHGGYTGTIADKGGFTLFAIPTRAQPSVIDALGQYWVEYDWGELGSVRQTPKVKKEHWPKGFGKKYRELVRRLYQVYDDKWGAAVCIELRGKAAERYKRFRRPRRGQKVFYFCGMASE